MPIRKYKQAIMPILNNNFTIFLDHTVENYKNL